MSLESIIKTQVRATQTSSKDLGAASFPLNYTNTLSMATGTGGSQSDLLFSDTRTIAASGTEDIDLAGTLIGAFGNTLTFVNVKAIMIKASSANTNDVTVSPASSNGFLGPFNAAADLVSIPPNGMMLVTAPVDGWTVAAGTGDLITIANSSSGTEVVYDIVIIGTSA